MEEMSDLAETAMKYASECSKLRNSISALEAKLEKYEWRCITTLPKEGVVLLCDVYGNRWMDCVDWVMGNGCGFSPAYWMPLPARPANISGEINITAETTDKAAQ